MFDVLPAVVYVPPEYLPSVLPRICIRARLLCGRLSGDDHLYGQCSPARTRRERAGLQGRREHQRGRDATLGRLGVGDSEQRLVTQQPQQLELGRAADRETATAVSGAIWAEALPAEFPNPAAARPAPPAPPFAAGACAPSAAAAARHSQSSRPRSRAAAPFLAWPR